MNELLYQKETRIVTITLNRPDRLNALNPALQIQILEAINSANADKEVRVVILTGAGSAFCAGADLKANLARAATEPINPVHNQTNPIRDKIVLAIRQSEKTYIAAVNGAAAGGGMGLALACDIRIASSTAKFSQPFVKIGMHPDWGGTYFLPRLIGIEKAYEMIITGRIVEAKEAHVIGIVSQLVKPDELMSTVHKLAKRLSFGPPIAMSLLKRCLYRNLDVNLKEALLSETYAQNICLETKDVKEGVTAFVEKRRPIFKGE